MKEVNGMLKDVLLKNIGKDFHDSVLIVNELPKSLFYQKDFPKIPEVDRASGKLTARLIRDRKAGKIMDELKHGVTISLTGDGAYVFNTMTNAGRERFEEVQRYIIDKLPVNATRPRFEFVCMEVGNPSSPPKPRSEFPRVELPVSSPPAEEKSSVVQDSPSNLLNTASPIKRRRKV